MRNTRNYRLLVLVAFLQGIVFYGPVATIYRRAFGLDLQGLFVIESISWLLTIALEAPFGWFADRFGYRKTLLAGNLVFLASKVVFSVASGFGGFLAERLLLSVAVSALSGCSEAMVYRSAGASHAPQAFGRWHAAGGAGLTFAALTAPLVYGVSLRLASWATVVPYLAATVATLFLIDMDEPSDATVTRPTGPRHGMMAAFRNLFSDPALPVFLVAAGVLGEAAQAATVFLAPLQYERAGIPLVAFGVLFAALQAVSLASGLAERASTAVGNARVFPLLALAAAAALAVLAMTDSAPVSIGALVLVALTAALFRPLSAAWQNGRVRSTERATSLSVNALVIELTAAVMNVGAGRAAAHGLKAGFGFLAIGCLAAGVLLAVAVRKWRAQTC